MSEYFPTEFAKELAYECKLFPRRELEFYYDVVDECSDKRKRMQAKTAIRKYNRLVSFQNLSVSGSLKDALIAYKRVELTEEQEEVLASIHSSTVTWAKGKLADETMTRLSGSSSNKEFKELAQTMMVLLGMEVNGGTGKVGEAGGGFEPLVIIRDSSVAITNNEEENV